MDGIVNELSTFIFISLQKTELGSRMIDVSKVREKLVPLIEKSYSRLQQQDQQKIFKFMKNQAVLYNCIVPNIIQIFKDNKIDLQDTPYFLSMIFGVYTAINEFLATDKSKITISSNDIIELTSLLVRIVLSLLITDEAQFSVVNGIIEQVVLLVKFKIGSVKCSCFPCCK